MRRLLTSLQAVPVFLTSLMMIATAFHNARGEEPTHGIAMHGEPALPSDFSHFPYVNPDAPKGGSITYGVRGTFDSLNPFILKSMRTTARGVWDFQFGNLVYETLLARSRDEAFTMYGLLAESMQMPDDRSWIEFNLNPAARWSDGEPLDVDDVIFSFELLRDKGRPPFSSRMKRIERIEKKSDRVVRFWLNDEADREFPLIIGLTPILPRHAIDPETFDQSTLEPPIASGPYLVSKVEPGKRIVFERDPDYWGKDIPTKVGMNNYDRITIEYFRQTNILFEAFRKGLVDVYPEGDPAHWQRAYDFPAVNDGRIVKDVFKTGKPANMLALAFNTRRQVFTDRKVRQALSMLFDFEWANENLYFGAYKRTASFWHGSELSYLDNQASAKELELFEKYGVELPEEILDGSFRPPVTNGSGRDRKVMRKAYRLLQDAGYEQRDGALVTPQGEPLTFEIITQNQSEERIALIFQRVLDRLGIVASIRTLDDSQFQRQTQVWDYDMRISTYSASLSPGAEQLGRWSTQARDAEGTFNYAGVGEAAIDAMIDELIQARSKEDFVSVVRALDRMLIAGHYVIPLFHIDEQWIARWSFIERPDVTPIYGAQFETWWDGRVTE